MAFSTCVKCGGRSFEAVEHSATNAHFKHIFIQCASCGGVVGVTDYANNASLLLSQNKAIKKIAQQVGVYVELEGT